MKFEKIKDDHAEAHQTVVSNIVARDDVDDNQWAQFNLYILNIQPLTNHHQGLIINNLLMF